MDYWATTWKRVSNSAEIPRSLDQLINDSFAGDKFDLAKEFLEQTYTNMRITESALRKSLIRLFFLFFIFLLLIETKPGEFNFGFIKIEDITIIIKFFPLIISVNYYELSSLACMFIIQNNITYYILKFLHKPIVDNHLHIFLYSSTIPHTTEGIVTSMLKEGPLNRLNFIIYIIFMLIAIFGAVAFEWFTFYINFQKYGTRDLLLLTVTIASLIIMIKTILNIIIAIRIFGKSAEVAGKGAV